MSFKVGDRVRFIGAPMRFPSFHVGGEYLVSDVSRDEVFVEADDEGDGNGWKLEYFELVQPASL